MDLARQRNPGLGPFRKMNPDTLLYRQIHPSWVKVGRTTSQAFRPTPKDHNRLSVYDGDQITAEAAWNHYTLKLPSDGVMAVTLAECQQQQLTAIADPLQDFPAHALIDFTELTGNEARRVARQLNRAANARGWQFGPVAHPYA